MKLASSLETDVSSIRKNDATDQPLVSHFEMNTVFILENNANALKLASSIEIDVVSIRKNNAPDRTVASSLATISSLLSFTITALSFNFHCITGIDFTYHPTLSHSHVTRIESIFPILRLLAFPSILSISSCSTIVTQTIRDLSNH